MVAFLLFFSFLLFQFFPLSVQWHPVKFFHVALLEVLPSLDLFEVVKGVLWVVVLKEKF